MFGFYQRHTIYKSVVRGQYIQHLAAIIARRTVAKYREALKIPSSVQRRRLLKTA